MNTANGMKAKRVELELVARVPINNDNLRIPTSKGGRWPRKGCGVGESRCEGQRGASDQLAPPATLIQPAHRWLDDPPDAEGL